jgi:hypothetical protein
MSASLTSCRVGSLVCSTWDSVRTTRIRSPPSTGPIPPPGHEPARRRIPPGELDTGRLSDHTAAPVAPDQIVRPERRAVGQRDVDAGIVLGEPCHLTFARGRHPELIDPGGQ